MKKTLFFAAVSLLTVVFTSCESAYTYTYRESTARYMELMRTGFIKPVTAEMEVQAERIEYSVELEVEISEKDIKEIMSANNSGKESSIVLGWKKEALAQTAKHFHADDMVAPMFEIAPHPKKEGVLVVTVTGYPAVYKNFRTITKDDAEMILKFYGHGDKGDSSAEPSSNKKSIFKL